MKNYVADFAAGATKNLGDFGCDVNPAVGDKAQCHENVAAASEKVREVTENPVAAAAKSTLDKTINDFITNFLQGVTEVFHNFVASWLHAGPVIDLNGEGMQWGKNILSTFMVFAVAIGISITGIKAVWYARGDDIRVMIPGVLKVSLIAAGGSFFVATMATASDAAAQWIVDMSAWNKQDTDKMLAGDIGKLVAQHGSILLLLGGLLLLVLLIQWCIMIFQAFVLPIMVMYWPISEAMGFAAGQYGLSRTARWILAFLLFKPTVAVLYGFAFVMMKGSDGLGGFVMALCIITISVFALPGLLKVVMPSAAGTGADGGGAALAALGKFGLAVGAAAATGGASAAAGGAAAGGASGGVSTANAFQPGATLGEAGQMPAMSSSASQPQGQQSLAGGQVSQSQPGTGVSPSSQGQSTGGPGGGTGGGGQAQQGSQDQPQQSSSGLSSESSSGTGGAGPEGEMQRPSSGDTGQVQETVPLEASPAGGNVGDTSGPSSVPEQQGPGTAGYQGQDSSSPVESAPVDSGAEQQSDAEAEEQQKRNWVSRGVAAAGRGVRATAHGAVKAATHPAVLSAANQQARYSKHSAEEKIFDQSQIDNTRH